MAKRASGTDSFGTDEDVVDSDGELFETVYEARNSMYAQHLGRPPEQVFALKDLFGIWPGGNLMQIHALHLGKDIWVHSSFGLSNPNMPATMRMEGLRQTETTTSGWLKSRPKRNVAEGLAGYGYEMLVLTRGFAEWPLS